MLLARPAPGPLLKGKAEALGRLLRVQALGFGRSGVMPFSSSRQAAPPALQRGVKTPRSRANILQGAEASR